MEQEALSTGKASASTVALLRRLLFLEPLPPVRRVIVDSLRYWVGEMHVDGFRFDLASILAHDARGHVLPNPPVLWDIESDPLLAGTKLIAEAWDAAGLYQGGNFIGDSWREWNGRFRDDARDFSRGAEGTIRRIANEPPPSSKRVLEPADRIAEVLFGLIMVLTFTGSLSVAEAGRDDVRTLLIGALGGNLAWGLIDGLLHLMGCVSEQVRSIRAGRALRNAAHPSEAHRALADALPPMVAAAVGPEESASSRQKLLQRPGPPSRPRLGKDEWLGALAVALWVIVTCFPVALPFILMQDVPRAMRVSNAIAVVLLFLAGWAFGRLAAYRPWLTGLAMVVLGIVLVSLTMALGG